MSDSPARNSAADGLEAVSVGGDALIGLATLGKTAAALGLVLVIIFAASVVLKRLQLRRQPSSGRLRVVSATAVGPRERVVIVEVGSRWLVLGVASGQVSKLHELPAPPPEETPRESSATGPAFAEGDSFATRFAKALRHNAGRGNRPGADTERRE